MSSRPDGRTNLAQPLQGKLESQGTAAWQMAWVIPVGLLALQAGARLLSPAHYRALFEGERGLVEQVTALAFLGAAMAFAWCGMSLRSRRPRACVLAATMSVLAVLLAGEELSWGQHHLGWAAPTYFEVHNRQSETNLHNLVDIRIERLASLALHLGALIAGLALPILARRAGCGAAHLGPLYPSVLCIGPAAALLAVRAVERMATWTQTKHLPLLDIRLKETSEMLVAFVLVTWAVGAVAAARKERTATGT